MTFALCCALKRIVSSAAPYEPLTFLKEPPDVVSMQASHICGTMQMARKSSSDHLQCIQGLSEEDARAALLECPGDGDAALLYAVQCMGEGGAAQVRFRTLADEAARAEVSGDTSARDTALRTEVESVLQRFSEGGLT